MPSSTPWVGFWAHICVHYKGNCFADVVFDATIVGEGEHVVSPTNRASEASADAHFASGKRRTGKVCSRRGAVREA